MVFCYSLHFSCFHLDGTEFFLTQRYAKVIAKVRKEEGGIVGVLRSGIIFEAPGGRVL